MIRRLLLSGMAAALFSSGAYAAEDSLETVEVTASREKLQREIQEFVHQVTRIEGEFVGRWRKHICPMVIGLSDAQAQFMRQRLIEVQNTVRKLDVDANKKCAPNLFIIVTDEADQVIAGWKERDPGMFRWKSREGVARSAGVGPVRTWHNAIMEGAQGDPIDDDPTKPPQGRLIGSRIQASYSEHITAVVVLVDARATGKVSLAQLTDFISVLSLSQIDLSANLGGVDSILRLFAQPPPDVVPTGITEWDYAFLNGLYRASYSPMNQQRDIAARMVRELAPR